MDLIDRPEKREEIRKRTCECSKDALSVECIAERLYIVNKEIFVYRAPDISLHSNKKSFLRSTHLLNKLYFRAKPLIKKVLKRIPGFKKLAGYFAETRRLGVSRTPLEMKIIELQSRIVQLE